MNESSTHTARIVNPEVEAYVARLVHEAHADPVLDDMGARAAAEGFCVVGPRVARLLELAVWAVGARWVIEPGSGFGYSAYWFARAVEPTGPSALHRGGK